MFDAQDEDFLQSLGLTGLPDDQKKAFLQHIYEELELRVGTRLSEGVPDDELQQLEKSIDANDDQAALKWLEEHNPDYKDIISDELEKLKQEIITNRDAILGTAA